MLRPRSGGGGEPPAAAGAKEGGREEGVKIILDGSDNHF
jgi:hypothetical protein